MKVLLTVLVGIVGLAQAQDLKLIEGQLSTRLKGAKLILKTPRMGSKLRFDVDGKSDSREGIRGFDDKIEIIHVHLANDELQLKGIRMDDVYDSAYRTVKSVTGYEQVEIKLSLKSETEEGIAASLGQVFKSAGESSNSACSDYRYIEEVITPKQQDRKPKDKMVSDKIPTGTQAEVCMPSGARAWRADTDDSGVTLPKPIRVEAPDVTSRPQMRSHLSALILIDERGLVTDGILVNVENDSLVSSFTKAIQTWKFKPAEKDGKPVPVLMHAAYNQGGWFR